VLLSVIIKLNNTTLQILLVTVKKFRGTFYSIRNANSIDPCSHCSMYDNLNRIIGYRNILYKKDGYRQQNVRQRQKLISIIDYIPSYRLWRLCDFLLVRHCNYSSILYYLLLLIFVFNSIITSMARNSLLCADVPLRNYSLTPLVTQVSCGEESMTIYSCSYNDGLIEKSYMVYRTAPFSMTLKDPIPRFQGQAIL